MCILKSPSSSFSILFYSTFKLLILFRRDVKPGNLLVHDGHLKLADFGLTMLIQNVKDAPAAGTILYVVRFGLSVCLRCNLVFVCD